MGTTCVKLFKNFIRPHLEYAIQAWCPWTEADMKLLEDVQKRAIKLIPGITGSYEEKLRSLGMTTLRERRIRGDAIEAFKILNGFYDVDKSIWFEPAAREAGMNTRQSSSVNALKSQRARLE